MNNTTKAVIFSAVVLLASITVLAMPASADEAVTTTTKMTAEEFMAGASEGKLAMDKDVELKDALTISTELELDLKGHKLVNGCDAHTITVSKGGKLTVKDSVGGGIVDNVNHGKGALYVDAGAEAVLNGGTFERSAEAGKAPSGEGADGNNSWYTIANRGTITINDGTTVLNGDAKTTGRFSSMIGNGYPSASDNEDGYDVVLTINGGKFVGGLYNVKNDDYGVLTINGGTFVASSGLCNILNWNDLTVKGGQFSSEVGIINAWDTSATYNRGIINISSGTFDCPDRIVYLGMQESSTYALDIAIDGIEEGKMVVSAVKGVAVSGNVSVNKNAVVLTGIIAGEKFALSVGSIDIEGAYTSVSDGSIVVKGDAKISGTIDGSVTVRVESGSITVPEGKTLTGEVQMGDGKSSVDLAGITAGKGGFTITPTTIGGTASASAEGSSITVAGSVTVDSDLALTSVELSVPEGSTLTVSEKGNVSGGTIENAGSISVAGTVQTTITNTSTAKVTATAAAKVSDVKGDGSFVQDKPTVEKVETQYYELNRSVKIPVKVSEGATLKVSGVSWATYKDGFITGTPGIAGEYTIIATPEINGNAGDSISFKVIVEQADDPVEPVEPAEPEKDNSGATFKIFLIVIVVILLVAFIVSRL